MLARMEITRRTVVGCGFRENGNVLYVAWMLVEQSGDGCISFEMTQMLKTSLRDVEFVVLGLWVRAKG